MAVSAHHQISVRIVSARIPYGINEALVSPHQSIICIQNRVIFRGEPPLIIGPFQPGLIDTFEYQLIAPILEIIRKLSPDGLCVLQGIIQMLGIRIKILLVHVMMNIDYDVHVLAQGIVNDFSNSCQPLFADIEL